MTYRTHLLFVYISLCLLSLYHTNASALERPEESRIVGFSWQNCGADADPFYFNSFSLAPDPIRIPGDVTVGISMTLTIPFPPDVTVIVVMEKQVAGFYIKVPCVNNVGSCVYHDVCKNSANANQTFFENFGLGGKCPPLPPGIYSMANVVEHVTKSLPPEASGNFRITVNPLSGAVGQLGCIQALVNIQG